MGFIKWRFIESSDWLDVEAFTFPGGEEQVKIGAMPYLKSSSNQIQIRACIQNSSDLWRLVLTIDAFRHINPHYLFELFMPYIPYARQDRVMNKGESLSLRIFANLINSLGFSEIVVYDPHSDVSTALINNVRVMDQATIINNFGVNYIKEIHSNDKEIVLVAPDGGALKKIHQVARHFNTKKVVTAEKKRNTKTGEITETWIPSGYDFFNDNVLVVDDICDGGKTFIELGKVLKQDELNSLTLYVTHGIFSKGFDELFQYYDRIITTNSFRSLEEEKLKYKQLTVINIWR